jgi:hypothetical protein
MRATLQSASAMETQEEALGTGTDMAMLPTTMQTTDTMPVLAVFTDMLCYLFRLHCVVPFSHG